MMTAKQYLARLSTLDLAVKTKTEILEHLQSLAEKVTSTISDMASGTSGEHNKREDTMLKIVMLQQRLKDDIDMLVSEMSKAYNLIQNVTGDYERIVLEKRYLNNERWEEIAIDLNMCERTVHRIHGNALQKIKIPQSCQ